MGDIAVEEARDPAIGRRGLEPLGSRLAETPLPAALVRVGQGLRPPAGRLARGRGDPEDRTGRPAGRIVEQLPKLREAELDQPVEALADLRLLLDERHREVGGLAQLGTGERIAGGWRVAHSHLGKAPGIGRVGLRPGEPTLGKVLRRERVDHRDRDTATLQMYGERHP